MHGLRLPTNVLGCVNILSHTSRLLRLSSGKPQPSEPHLIHALQQLRSGTAGFDDLPASTLRLLPAYGVAALVKFIHLLSLYSHARSNTALQLGIHIFLPLLTLLLGSMHIPALRSLGEGWCPEPCLPLFEFVFSDDRRWLGRTAEEINRVATAALSLAQDACVCGDPAVPLLLHRVAFELRCLFVLPRVFSQVPECRFCGVFAGAHPGH
eukprot:EG_transcript_27299